MRDAEKSRLGYWVNEIEEVGIAALLGLMALVTFANVVARYVFQSNLLWALETTTYLFAWLVLFGISHAVKISANLGVDAVLNYLSPPAQRICALIAVTACLAFTVLLLYGGWDYWSKFAFKLSFLEAEDIPFPVWIQSLLGYVEDGEPIYEKIPRFIPYVILPFGMALLLIRYLQAAVRIWRGEQRMLIASHEIEAMEESK
ncbi:MAG: TRAP transporter small permease [Pseudomonadota bacterium]